MLSTVQIVFISGCPIWYAAPINCRIPAGIVVALLPDTVSDNGAATGYLLGVPVVAALLPLAADLTGRTVGATTALCALVMLVWGLLLGLGDGVYVAVPALVLGAAAIASITPRRGLPVRERGDRPVDA